MNESLRRLLQKSRWTVYTVLGTLVAATFLISASNLAYDGLGRFDAVFAMNQSVMEPMEVDEEAVGCDAFREKIVHFDLKGIPPKVAYYSEIFPLLEKLRVSGILMEYEDMFPFTSDLAVVARENAYTIEEIHEICRLAHQHHLEVIPLVQTFGHLEFVLKHERFSHLREVPLKIDTICPSDSRSHDLIHEMLKQIYRVHSEAINLTTIHIGADEAWSIAQDERCRQRLSSQLGNSTDRLKASHISSVAQFVKDQLGVPRVLVWNDMFDKVDWNLMNEYELGRLVVPNIWGYIPDVTREGYFPAGMFERYSHTFNKILFASAFKGANGVDQNFISMKRYMANLYSYVALCRANQEHIENRISGIILTGWQRYNHELPLCELLPVGIPTLVAELLLLNGNDYSVAEDSIIESALRFLKCDSSVFRATFSHNGHSYVSPVDTQFATCEFPGREIFVEIEKLRFVVWKIENFDQKRLTEEKKKILQEIDKIEENIKPLLEKYFYKPDIEEWLAVNFNKYRTFEDKGATPARLH
ncbi:hypothetical protein L596_011228 [Steinernema carpocapsae]|uniref:beta-N-acetylhexosaminidase n=1 Tax=Steinernema carpocapsae TaxID=34508 RepID=A0A4U5NT59_STECR|nr:hypothetical protein L596_011228 [Steinernema carpocapsae]